MTNTCDYEITPFFAAFAFSPWHSPEVRALSKPRPLRTS